MPEEHLVVIILTTGRCYEENAVLFGCNAILSGKYLLVCQGSTLPPCSGFMRYKKSDLTCQEDLHSQITGSSFGAFNSCFVISDGKSTLFTNV